MAWRNITTKKFRSALTITGVAIGIGSIFFLLSFGLGLRTFVTDQLVGNKSIKSIDVNSQNSKVISLSRENVEKITNLPKVDKVGVSYSMAGKAQYQKSQIDIIVYGADFNFRELSYLSIIGGQGIQKNDGNSSILISKSAMQGIGFDKADQIIGKEISISVPIDANNGVAATTMEKTFLVKGVFDSGSGSEVFIDRAVFGTYSISQYSQLKLSTDDEKNVSALRHQIESMGFNTNSPIDTIDQVNQIFSYFNAALLGFGLIGMIIAVLGMLNTLTVSLIERVNEIGLLISLGGRHKDMKRLFVYEAVLLSLIGSLIGMAVSILLELGINWLINQIVAGRGYYGPVDLFYVPIWLVFGLTGFMLLVGYIVSQMPARKASKINPVDSMRQQ